MTKKISKHLEIYLHAIRHKMRRLIGTAKPTRTYTDCVAPLLRLDEKSLSPFALPEIRRSNESPDARDYDKLQPVFQQEIWLVWSAI